MVYTNCFFANAFDALPAIVAYLVSAAIVNAFAFGAHLTIAARFFIAIDKTGVIDTASIEACLSIET